MATIIYKPTVNNRSYEDTYETPEYTIPEFQGYKRQFNIQPVEEPKEEIVEEEPYLSEEDLNILETDGSAKDKARITNKYLQQQLGITPEQAAALVGIWQAESGFNLNAENKAERAGKNSAVRSSQYGIGIGQ